MSTNVWLKTNLFYCILKLESQAQLDLFWSILDPIHCFRIHGYNQSMRSVVQNLVYLQIWNVFFSLIWRFSRFLDILVMRASHRRTKNRGVSHLVWKMCMIHLLAGSRSVIECFLSRQCLLRKPVILLSLVLLKIFTLWTSWSSSLPRYHLPALVLLYPSRFQLP